MGSPTVLVAPSESMTIDGRVTLVRCEPPNLANSMVSLRAQSFDRCPPVCDPLHLKDTTPPSSPSHRTLLPQPPLPGPVATAAAMVATAATAVMARSGR